MDKLSIVIGNYIDVECDANTTPRQAYERGFRRATEKCEAVMRSRKIENDQLKSENASLGGAAQGLGDLCDKYKAENAKLRDLINDLLRLPTAPAFDCFNCKYDEHDDCDYGRRCKLVERARDFGIEVNE